MTDFAEQKETENGLPLPEAFTDRMQELLKEEEYAAFLSSFRQKRLYSLRLNPLKTERGKALAMLQKAAAGQDVKSADGELKQVPWEPDGFYYSRDFRPGRLPWHEAGMYYIQEASAMVPAVLCGAKPGERVLDLCAAPGGKSTKLAACLRGEGILVANEIHPERARVLSSNLERMGIRNALVTNEPPHRLASRFPLFFDRIVVDAPCSGEGMFRKEEEALTHWSPENVRMCAERQSEIMEEAASMLRPGGRLVYSTCTFSPEENEGTIVRFLKAHPEFSVVPIAGLPSIQPDKWGFAAGRPEWVPGEEDPDQSVRETVRLWPHLLEGEGHFAAVLTKKGRDSISNECTAEQLLQIHDSGFLRENGSPAVVGPQGRDEKRSDKKEVSAKKKHRGRKGGKRDPKKEEALRLWYDFCRENLNCSDAGQSGEEYFLLFGDTLYMLPVPVDSLSLEGLRILRPGLQLGEITKGRFTPSHALGMALTENEVLRTMHLQGDRPEAYAWLRGEAVSLPEGISKGWCLVCIDGCAVGWGKAAGSMLKNHYPRGLRKGSSYRPG